MSEAPDLIIEWEGPYNLSAFLELPNLRGRFDKPGVYIWVERLPNGKNRLSYVGRAAGRPSLWRRQLQHYAFMVGGQYTIPKEFTASGTDWMPDWTKPEIARIFLDQEKFAAVVEDGFRYARACQVYLWVAPPGVDVRVVERNLLYDLQPTSTDWGKGSPPPARLKISHRSPAWLSDEVRAQVRSEVEFL